jgi:hypothetical protein
MLGSFLSIDIGTPASWPPSTKTEGEAHGLNLSEVSIEDIVDTALAAQAECGITYAFLRGNLLGNGGLAGIFPCVQALKRDVGILVGVQFPPETDLSLYERARDLGVDHFSFLFDCFSDERTGHPGCSHTRPDHRARAMTGLEHCARIMGRGRVSGELMAGREPVEETMRGIDCFVRAGVIPLIAVFRPMPGTETADLAPPDFADMLRIFRYVYQACSSHHLPFGLAPNIHLSELLHPEDTLYLAPDMRQGEAYRRWILTMQQVMRPYFLRRMRKQAAPRA